MTDLSAQRADRHPARRRTLDAGWTDDHLAELSAHVTLNLLTNYFNHFVKTDLDLPVAPAL